MGKSILTYLVVSVAPILGVATGAAVGYVVGMLLTIGSQDPGHSAVFVAIGAAILGALTGLVVATVKVAAWASRRLKKKGTTG